MSNWFEMNPKVFLYKTASFSVQITHRESIMALKI